jgi:Tol biopolymer transport system component
MDPQRWARIESLYHAALKKGPAESADYLANACINEPELRREVESLLDFADTELRSPLAMGERWPSGFRLGSYEIIGALGAGGMGEVYRARDIKLLREVAIKVLPREFQNDASRLALFEREARLLASLNHPNIAAIYGFEYVDGIRFLVLELVEGPTLSERLKSGPIEVPEALRIAIGITEALEAAHGNNVVHRDLKPGNVKITPAGKVKVLDFGLAKALGDTAGSGDTNASTEIQGETKTGMVMGTAAYMSPEQAEAKITDKRSDVWSFGVVLYEMLSGKRCFDGQTTSHVLVHILEQEPDWQALPTSAPVGVRPLLEQCLTKDPAERLRDIGDVRVQLRALEKETKPASNSGRVARVAEAGPPLAPAKETRRAWLWPTAGGALAVAALAREFLYFRPKPAPAVPLVRFEIAAPAKARLIGAPAISPDGRNLAFLAAGADNVSRLWIRSLEKLEPRPFEGTEGAVNFVFWSPESRYIVFQTSGKLHRIEAAGGPPVTLCNFPFALFGGLWTNENKIILGAGGGWALFEVPAAGGPLEPFTTQGSKEHIDAFPSLLPDGRHFVYSHLTRNSSESGGIYLGSLDEKVEKRAGKRILADISAALFAPSPDPAFGYLLFVRDASTLTSSGTLMAQLFDNRKLELAGDAVPVADQVPMAGFSASASGVLVYGIGAPSDPQTAAGAGVFGQLTWFDRGGTPLSTVAEPGLWQALALSPDNTKVAFNRTMRGNTDIWTYELARRVATPLTTDPALDTFPVWNTDGSRIAFFSDRKQPGIYQRRSNGAGEDELLVKVDRGQFLVPSPGGWSQDGRFILLTSTPQATSEAHLWVLPITAASAADRKIVPLVKPEFNERGGQFSPDDHWIAYTSNRSGEDEVYLREFDPDFLTGSGNPSPGGAHRVSQGGGTGPLWQKDGKEMFYITPNGGVMAVDVSDKTKPGIPKQLFKVPAAVVYWCVANDGQRFLIPVAAGTVSGDAAPYKVVLNWTSLLKH